MRFEGGNMLAPGILLQNRYRMLRQIGGGGMGVVYLAEDTRLAGRRCAIKEMSPEQVAAQDRNWAIQAFQQEAQMLAHLNHPGLTAVTDFLPEEGNWYLVMDYAEGETLQSRLERSPGGRLPLDEALNVTHQLCNVLEYLHGQRPPVVFRDLKPGNVMLTPEGEVKLIDFGIARFFKAGQTRDTVSLGTPGYAAPELYGSRGQSDPRTDVYSLGTLLLQMVTGYDPAAAVTPFPLPTPESLMRGLPAHVEEVISRATRVQPELRHQSTIEFRQALFPPTWVLPPPGMPTAPPYVPTAPQAQARPASGLGKRIWIGLGIAGILLIGVCTLVLGIWIVPMFFPTPTVPSSPAAMSTSTPTVTPVATEPPTTLVPTSSPAIEPATEMALHWISIGRSAQGRDLTAAVIGDARGAAVVVVGSIQGDQPNTRDLVEALIGNFERDSARIPANVAFHFIPTINPDGNAASTRRNANNVDLNRNWDTFDWTPDPEQPEGVVRGAGGSRRNSEPETQSLANYLLSLQRQNPDLRLVLLHSSQRITSGGHVYPGYTSSGLEPNAIALAQRYASVTGYALKEDWAPYETTGELIAWCAEEGIEAIDVVIPGASSGSDSNLRRTTMEALLEIARFP
jgi:serine/threonine-protein kinase